MYSASKTTRVRWSYSQGEKANTRRERLLTPLKRNLSLLMSASRTSPSMLLTDPHSDLEKSHPRSPKILLMSRSTRNCVNCKLTRTIRARESLEPRKRLKRRQRNELMLFQLISDMDIFPNFLHKYIYILPMFYYALIICAWYCIFKVYRKFSHIWYF